MPLTEFLRMVNAKPDAASSKASTSDDPSYRPDTDCVELVWENGQVTTMQQQGQSSKPIRPPSFYNFPTHATPKHDDDSNIIRMSNGSKVTKLSTMDSMLDDFPMSISVPSCEMGLDQDNADIVPWLNYAIHDPLHNNNDYTSDFLREFSGVTIVDLPPEPRERKSSLASSKHGFSSPKPAPEKHPFFLPFEQQHNVSKPGSSGVTVTTNTSSAPTSASGFTNFSCLYRPTEISRAHNLTANNSVRLESCDDDKRCALRNGALATSTANSAVVHEEELLPAKPTEKLHCYDHAGFQVDVTKKNSLEDQGHQHHGKAGVTKAKMGGEKNKEPVVAIATSSVCSGNSVERASNDHGRDYLKRKARENGESDGQSDDADEESMGARKGASSRTGGKRSRAAEVHNLSERRRRDRINEKMRALQELIPNCNKVDKASMLDEAIEYLKTLQLQVQMLSMGSGGMYMHPTMMVPTHPAPPPPGMHPMGLGMGFGMNMLDPTTGTIKLMPFQGPPQFLVMGPGPRPVPGPGPAYHMMPGLGLGLHPFAQPIQRPLKVPLAPAPPNVAPSCSSNPKDGIGPQPTMPGSSGSNRAAREKVQAVNTAASGTGTRPS